MTRGTRQLARPDTRSPAELTIRSCWGAVDAASRFQGLVSGSARGRTCRVRGAPDGNHVSRPPTARSPSRTARPSPCAVCSAPRLVHGSIHGRSVNTRSHWRCVEFICGRRPAAETGRRSDRVSASKRLPDSPTECGTADGLAQVTLLRARCRQMSESCSLARPQPREWVCLPSPGDHTASISSPARFPLAPPPRRLGSVCCSPSQRGIVALSPHVPDTIPW